MPLILLAIDNFCMKNFTQDKILTTYIVESRNYAPLFVYASIGRKWGGGLFLGSLHFRVTTITDRRMPCAKMQGGHNCGILRY